MYFQKFPVVLYTNTENGDPKLVTHLLKRVGVREPIKTNGPIFSKYIVRGGETPESLAFDFYGDAELHWVILLFNDIYDRYHQWPMNHRQFLACVTEKYDDPNGTHHYELTQASGDTTTKINIGQDNSAHASATVVTNYEHEEAEQDKKRQIKILQRDQIGQFVSQFNLLMGK